MGVGVGAGVGDGVGAGVGDGVGAGVGDGVGVGVGDGVGAGVACATQSRYMQTLTCTGVEGVCYSARVKSACEMRYAERRDTMSAQSSRNSLHAREIIFS